MTKCVPESIIGCERFPFAETNLQEAAALHTGRGFASCAQADVKLALRSFDRKNFWKVLVQFASCSLLIHINPADATLPETMGK